ncbi:MAG TPA: hypothetical protein VFV75_03040 [Candidatus Polarisedimenticolaceae bacterium]|nr:hypothetical protein [Candidatus Polarisedimenticolaceae bacterium]
MRRGLVAMVTAAMLMAGVPARAAEGGTGSAVGRVTPLHKGSPAVADPSWKVRFTSRTEGAQPIELPLKEGVYETPQLPVGTYDVQVVDAFGQPVGEPQAVVLTPGAIRADLRVEAGKAGTAAQADKGPSWKVWAIVGGAAAALALAAGGSDGGSDLPASPVN